LLQQFVPILPALGSQQQNGYYEGGGFGDYRSIRVVGYHQNNANMGVVLEGLD